jgi:beta-mannosidase
MVSSFQRPHALKRSDSLSIGQSLQRCFRAGLSGWPVLFGLMAIDLSGTWRAALANDELRRNGVGLDVNDADWEPIEVPGHWRTNPAFADTDGPLLYRTRFDLERPAADERAWVVLDGVFYQGDVWLDGAYLGDPEGYFFPHAFDITALSRLTTDHVLAVEVTCSPQRDRRAKRNLTGIFQHWHCIDPEWNPGGLWRPVRIETTGAVRIDSLRVLPRDVSEARANVILRGQFDSDEARPVTIRTLVDGRVVAAQERPLAAGTNAVEWNIDIDNPRIWWPWSMGEQPLTDIAVEVVIAGVVSHRHAVRTGLREVSMTDWVFSINGERLFAKGANIGPTRMAIGDATSAELHRDVELAREAGLDLLRVHGHITRPDFYDAADELGMLVWQDFPLQWGYARSVRRQAVRQVERAVDVLGHHPSIALWCGHNEPFALPIEPGVGFDLAKLKTRYLAAQQLPSWNRTILDRWVKRSFEKSDETRPAIPHSGALPHLPQLDGTDSHLYFGWYHGDQTDLPRFAAQLPRMVRFVGEFGAQAVPTSAEFMTPTNWPNLDWDTLESRHGLQRSLLDDRVPMADHESFESWRDATQEYQASLIKHQVETLRRLKYHPTGGFCLFSLTDSYPSVSWSVLDHIREPKAGFTALVDACRPVIVVADLMAPAVAVGEAVALDVHVVSDLRTACDDAVVNAHLRWDGGEHSWQFGGDVPADSCVRVGMIRFVVPDVLGDLILDLTCVSGDVVATNRYRSTIRPA